MSDYLVATRNLVTFLLTDAFIDATREVTIETTDNMDTFYHHLCTM
jgi:hypothetical protein